MDVKKGKLFVFSAPSGAGKTTIVKRILKMYPDFLFSISATTRKKREGEKDGKDYFFISEDKFLEKIRDNKFLEWEKFYDYYYGTLKEFVEDNLALGKSIVLELDVKGGVSIKKNYPGAVLIYIMPPSVQELKKRLINRNTETEEDVHKRIERSKMELGYADRFDHVVINNDVDEATEEVKNIIHKELKEN